MKSALIVVLGLFLTPVAALGQELSPMPNSGTIGWGNWKFEYWVGDANEEGLVIKHVTWKGTSVLFRGSLPAIRVKYRGDGSSIGSGCGPWVDRIHWGNMELIKGAATHVTGRIFNDEVFEIAIFAQIGGYDLFQAWYFHLSGRLEPMLYSSGWSCGQDGQENDHKHHPYWRLDFDVEDSNNEVWAIRTKKNNQVQTFKFPTEWNDWRLDDDKEIAWSINKPGSNKHVLIRSPDNELRDPAGSPWFRFSSKEAAIRTYRESELEEWPFGTKKHLGYISPAESVLGSDTVFWAVGHLTHTWSASDENKPAWHPRGMIIDVNW